MERSWGILVVIVVKGRGGGFGVNPNFQVYTTFVLCCDDAVPILVGGIFVSFGWFC